MRMDFLSIFLRDFRGPRKTVFCLKITRSRSAGNHGALNTDREFKAAAWTLENKNGNVQYWFEVEVSF